MIKVFKIAEVILIICICLLVAWQLVVNLFIGAEQKNELFPYIDTRFAKGFTMDRWDDIRAGMPRDTVIKLLGIPMYEAEKPGVVSAEFRPPCAKFKMVYSSDAAWKYGDYAWCLYAVYLDDSMCVMTKVNHWYHD